jgi:transposase InsO family protein
MIVLLILATRKKAGHRLGTWKIFHEVSQDLKMMGIKIGRDRFYNIARCNGLLIKPKKAKRAKTTDSSKWRRQFQDLRVDFVPIKPEQLWVSDITYIKVGDGFAYLSLITDAFSRQIMGWHLHQDLSTDGCLIALERALARRVYPNTELIHHSDRGCQYCSTRYVEALKNARIKISMTQNGSPYENPLAESVNGQLKLEYDLDQIFGSLPKARAEVLTAIQKYNEYRPHGSIQLRKPAEYHLNWKMEKSQEA